MTGDTMEKIRLGPKAHFYPKAACLVCTDVDGTPNYIMVALAGFISKTPPLFFVGIGKGKHTNRGIQESGTFSVNVPSEDMMAAADYCGLASGKDVDKSDVFETFRGQLGTPMIKESPLCIECRVIDNLDYGGKVDIFVGEAVQVYSEERYFTDGKLDADKVRPIHYASPEMEYYGVGKKVGKAKESGKTYR